MVDIQIEKNTIIIDARRVEFNRPISKILEFDNFIVVLLRITGQEADEHYKNVYAVNHDGSIRWEIENVPERGGKYRPYSNIHKDDDELWANNVAGMKYRVDTSDGSLLDREFVK